MALRDWSLSRLVIVWAAWFVILFAAFLTLLVASPEGVQVRISPPEATGGLRWLLAAAGGIALVLPPAILTYFWYLARLRRWSAEPDAPAAGKT